MCRSRTVSFCLRVKQVPPEVLTLVGGFKPSVSHGNRMSKILRSEWNRQGRLYRDFLYNYAFSQPGSPCTKKRRWKKYCHLIDSTTETMWRRHLFQLCSCAARQPPPTSNVVHTTEDIQLPAYVRDTLGLGPKCATEPRLSKPKLLSMVRKISTILRKVRRRDAHQKVWMFCCGIDRVGLGHHS